MYKNIFFLMFIVSNILCSSDKIPDQPCSEYPWFGEISASPEEMRANMDRKEKAKARGDRNIYYFGHIERKKYSNNNQKNDESQPKEPCFKLTNNKPLIELPFIELPLIELPFLPIITSIEHSMIYSKCGIEIKSQSDWDSYCLKKHMEKHMEKHTEIMQYIFEHYIREITDFSKEQNNKIKTAIRFANIRRDLFSRWADMVESESGSESDPDSDPIA